MKFFIFPLTLRVFQKKKRKITKSNCLTSLNSCSKISQIIKEYGIKLEKKGNYLIASCPFHDDKSPSFFVNEKKGIYHCFGCGASGNYYSFLKNFRQTKNRKIKIMPEKKIIFPSNSGKNKETSFRMKLETVFFLTSFQSLLMLQIGWEYFYFLFEKFNKPKLLLELRGVSHVTARIFGVGYSSSEKIGLLKYFLIKKFSYQDIMESGLVFFNNKKTVRNSNLEEFFLDMFRNRIIIPIRNSKGAILGFGGRNIINSKFLKYLNTGDNPIFKKGKIVFSENIIKKSILLKPRIVLLVEGYLDTISLFQNGIRFSVSLLGTSIEKKQFQKAKKLTNDFHFIVCLDNDPAGKKATFKIFQKIYQEVRFKKFRISIANLKNFSLFKDPDELVYFRGSSVFVNEILNNSLPLLKWNEFFMFSQIMEEILFFDYIFMQIIHTFNLFQSQKKKEFSNKALDNLFSPFSSQNPFFDDVCSVFLKKFPYSFSKNKNFKKQSKYSNIKKKEVKFFFSFWPLNFTNFLRTDVLLNLFFSFFFPKIKNDFLELFFFNPSFLSNFPIILNKKKKGGDKNKFKKILSNFKLIDISIVPLLENIDFETFNFIQEKLFLPNNKFYIKLEKNKKFFYFYIIHYFFLLLEKKKFIVKKNIEKLINFYNHQKKKKVFKFNEFFFSIILKNKIQKQFSILISINYKLKKLRDFERLIFNEYNQ
jgi:DNA primase catalytic core